MVNCSGFRIFPPISKCALIGRNTYTDTDTDTLSLKRYTVNSLLIKPRIQREFVPKGSTKLHPLHNCSSKFWFTVYVEILQILLV